MAEAKKPKPAPEPSPTEPVEQVRASEASDPRVHQLLAERQTAVLNNNSAVVDAIDAQLADLGYGA